MSRYIDLDKLLEHCGGDCLGCPFCLQEHGADYCMLEHDMPTIDIVHCGECENNKCNTDGVPENWCYHFGYDVESDDYCSHGERIDNE